MAIPAAMEVVGMGIREEWQHWEGLTEAAAVQRLQDEGYNQLPVEVERGLWRLAAEVLREPMFVLLLLCGGIYFILGDLAEAVLLMIFVIAVMGITLYQERRAEQALQALRDLSSPRASVIREGKLRRIAGREVVRGDLVVLQEGDRVPADGMLVAGFNLMIDESLLTGEALPVQKMPGPDGIDIQMPTEDNLSCVYSGTLVVQGQGLARISATGTATEIGKIGSSLRNLAVEPTLLQVETRCVVRRLAVVGVSLCVLVTLAFGLLQQDWLQGILAGLTLAMALLPEEFPVVLTVFLALGAWRISKQRVLTRRMAAVECLGAATVLCVDKTGTLTENRMSVCRLYTAGHFFAIDGGEEELPEAVHELIEYSILASQKDPFDPMEQAIRRLGETKLAATEHVHRDWLLRREYPLSPELLAFSLVWQAPEGGEYIIAAKGAPEAIADLCHFTVVQWQETEEKIRSMAADGLRVLGVAKATFSAPPLPGQQHDFGFGFLGLIALADPVRVAVPAAVAECTAAGIRVVMITGDYPETAKNIARQVGLAGADRVVTGAMLDGWSNSELLQRIGDSDVFARVTPMHKLRLVQALKERGEIVAMTGDGVNDGPALKAAHIGVAMGGRGTDVAREAAALVLLEDDFSSIVQAVRTGRRIFDNLKKAMTYIFAVHVPIAGMTLIPVLAGWPMVLQPAHVVFLELVIDPACAVVFEAERAEQDVMRRPPRDPRHPLFTRNMICYGLIQGSCVLLGVLGIFSLAMSLGLAEEEARAMAFVALVLANLGLIMINRSWEGVAASLSGEDGHALWWITGGALFCLGLVNGVPLLRELFRFAELHVIDMVICLVVAIVATGAGAVSSRCCIPVQGR